jgi:hypothetical protein
MTHNPWEVYNPQRLKQLCADFPLSTWQVVMAAMTGLVKRLKCLQEGVGHPCGYKGNQDPLVNEINAAIAEKLVGFRLNRICNQEVLDSGHDRKHGDLFGKIEVRWTQYPNGGLILYHTDDDSRRFVLVAEQYPMMRIAGWLSGGDGKKGEWLQERFNADNQGRRPWLVPQDKVNAEIDSLVLEDC